MGRKRFTSDQIIIMLREAEVMLNQGAKVGEVTRKLEISEQTFYRWRKEYGGMRVDQPRRIKDLEKENTRLKRLVADLSLDNAILLEMGSVAES
jgi:putative transposase